jgi:hypothetical protein
MLFRNRSALALAAEPSVASAAVRLASALAGIRAVTTIPTR